MENEIKIQFLNKILPFRFDFIQYRIEKKLREIIKISPFLTVFQEFKIK
ncbi:hypothetical protein ES703_61918 [subsurface metagenome]